MLVVKLILRLLSLLMYSSKIHLIGILFCTLQAFSQECAFHIAGVIKDEGTNIPLDNASLYLEETKQGAISDDKGAFVFHNICEGKYHLVITHISCATKEIFIEVSQDTTVDLTIKHTNHDLEDVVIFGNSSNTTNQNTETISNQYISDNASQNLGSLVESIVGVSTIKNGNTIAKPVVQGNFGNRLTILNNGVAQSGQQWGNDHSPEIDPLVANKISVVKGVSALKYLGSNLGSVVLVEPNVINQEPHLHGKASYFFNSNGFGHGANLELQQYKKIGWKINATIKKAGDRSSNEFVLKNTGNQEFNIAFQLEKEYSSGLKAELYASSFNTIIGIFQGSQASNLTDLENILRSEQRFSNEDFSYDIGAPRQEVSHQLLKLHVKKELNELAYLDFTLAGQLNNREEFDNRRSALRDTPVLGLLNYNLFSEGKYHKRLSNNYVFNTGLQLSYTNNTNDSETGVLPLIPDYDLFQIGAFTTLKKKLNKNTIELGLRYDFTTQNVLRITRNEIPRRVVAEEDVFNNLNASISVKRYFSEHITGTYSLGYASRNPAINELYSFGLHQGVASFERGNPDLDTENGLKTNLELEGDINERFTFKLLGYFQRIQNYIFLEPTGFELTNRGALPSFEYNQVNAQIFGFDIATKWEITKSIFSTAKYAFIQGVNTSQGNIGIINLPSNNLRFGLGYQFTNAFKLFGRSFENTELGVNSLHVFKQNNISFDQELPLNIERTEFVPIPDGYTLLGLSFASEIQLGKNRLRLTGKVDNLLNIAYRDYLNRQRYFANDLGIDISFGASLKF